ncbi:MAG: hypothetical protein OSB10_10580 [Planctomycetota bacterium]|nr:hypothetical protein [Planctomycetota bacterium]
MDILPPKQPDGIARAFKEGQPDAPWVFFNPCDTTIPECSGNYRNSALVD